MNAQSDNIIPLHRGYVRPSDLAKLTRDAGAAYEGKRVYRELERFNAEHPVEDDLRAIRGIIYGLGFSTLLWAAIFYVWTSL